VSLSMIKGTIVTLDDFCVSMVRIPGPQKVSGYHGHKTLCVFMAILPWSQV
jgi:hypothetical protein